MKHLETIFKCLTALIQIIFPRREPTTRPLPDPPLLPPGETKMTLVAIGTILSLLKPQTHTPQARPSRTSRGHRLDEDIGVYATSRGNRMRIEVFTGVISRRGPKVLERGFAGSIKKQA